jgi:prepilin-type N-terminal cleavage/methylation domain-containing protein
MNIKDQKKGFTLIELLVVISIISLLASVILASMASARQKAVSSKITQGFKQLDTAIALYKDTYNKYPEDRFQAPGNWAYLAVSMEDLIAKGYMKTVPVEPNADDIFVYTATNSSYSLAMYCGGVKVQPNSYVIEVWNWIEGESTFPYKLPKRGWLVGGNVVNDVNRFCITEGSAY